MGTDDAAGKPLYTSDSRGQQFRTDYNQLRRPLASWLLSGAGPEVLLGHSADGESRPDPEIKNLLSRTYQIFDQAGVVTQELYDFKGNLLNSTRQLAVEDKASLDWSKTVDLDPEIYASRTDYDALNRPVELTTPHTPAMEPSVVRPGYNEANLLERMEANLRGKAETTPFITNINYNAKGQRTLIEYGILDNNADSRVKTTYQYDEKTFRLTQMTTTRDNNDLLALDYFYDPAGNITFIRDNAQQTTYFNNQRVDPSSDYNYDALYRLVEARGREHLGQTKGQLNPPTPPEAFNRFHIGLPHPGDGSAMGTYVEQDPS